MLIIFEPIILPNAKSASFLAIATSDVINSGNEVPNATTLILMAMLLANPNVLDILIVPLMNKSEPNPIRKNPMKSNINENGLKTIFVK